jgi:hypothetical protein
MRHNFDARLTYAKERTGQIMGDINRSSERAIDNHVEGVERRSTISEHDEQSHGELTLTRYLT